MRQKITLITLGVSDMKKSLDFYEKGLKWKRSTAGTEDMVVFPLNGIALGLYSRSSLAEDAEVAEEGSGFRGITLSFNAISENEVDSVLKEVESLGATIVKRAQKVFWGGYSGYFSDPDGHLIEVAYNPFWALDDKGNLDLPQ